MFGLRIITKREIALYTATILDLRNEIERMRVAVLHEQKRAEAAINLLLAKTQKAVLTPENSEITLESQDRMKEIAYNIFGEDVIPEDDEEKLLEKLQS